MSPDLLSTRAAARLVGRTDRTLQRWRAENFGPAFLRVHASGRGAVMYRRCDLELWLENRRVDPEKREVA